MSLERAALRARGAAGCVDVRRAARRLRPPRRGSRHPPGRRVVARHRLPDHPRGASQARIAPDHARRPARFLFPGDRADRERRPLPSACGAEEGPRDLRPTGPRRAPPGPASERRPARGRWSRSRTRAGRPGRPLPRRRRMGPHVGARHTRPRDRAGGRDAQGGPVRAGVPRRPHPVLVPTEEIAVSERALPAYPPDHYFNRELSWLEFNARVLEEAADPSNPLLERLKFLAIFSSNLDEFFEIRVAGLQQQVYAGVDPQDYGADGLAPADQLAAIERRVHELVAAQYRILGTDVLPGLAAGGIERVRFAELTDTERRRVDALFHASVYPVLTPLAIDPGHPFPHVHNKSLNIALVIERRNGGQKTRRHFAVVQVPAVLDRVVIVSTHGERRVRFVLLEDIIARHLGELFGGLRVVSHTVFRVTRNTDLTIEEEDAEDLLEMIEESLRQRRRSDPVRLEISADVDEAFVGMLTEAHALEARDVYRLSGPIDLTALMALHRLDGVPALKDEPIVPRVAPPFAQGRDVFDVIRSQDVLVHLPYESRSEERRVGKECRSRWSPYH